MGIYIVEQARSCEITCIKATTNINLQPLYIQTEHKSPAIIHTDRAIVT